MNAKQKSVPIRFIPNLEHLDKQDRHLLTILVEAAKQVDKIYLKQCNSPDGFDPDQPKNFFPTNVTKEMVEAYLAEHPESRADILSPFTVVVETPEGGLSTIPYSELYKEEMREIAAFLYTAAHVAKGKKFPDFLFARSKAFRTNTYRESDIAWIHANDGPFEFTIGPYESYADTLFGVKRTFECLLGLVVPEETRMAASFQNFVTKFDRALGERYGYVAKTTLTPMVVMDLIYSGGEVRHDHVPMAYNLPNEPDIHAEVGSKKVFIRNIMHAKFATMTIPIAHRLLRKEDVRYFDFDAYLQFVIGHESAHGLSFHFDGERFGPLGSAVEECKADVFGMLFLYFMADQGSLERQAVEVAVMQHLTDCLRQIRFGPHKAHAVGAVIQYKWFIERDALILTEKGLAFNSTQFWQAATALGDALYALAASANQDALESFVAEEGRTIPELVLQYLERLTDIPVDIEPIFMF
jgi:hypothetical protein